MWTKILLPHITVPYEKWWKNEGKNTPQIITHILLTLFCKTIKYRCNTNFPSSLRKQQHCTTDIYRAVLYRWSFITVVDVYIAGVKAKRLYMLFYSIALKTLSFSTGQCTTSFLTTTLKILWKWKLINQLIDRNEILLTEYSYNTIYHNLHIISFTHI